MDDRRVYGVRRDINDLVRDESGKISGSKLGTYAGQYIAGNLLMTLPALPTWDVLGVLFCVLIAPEFYKRLMMMRYGGVGGIVTERTEKTEKSTTTKETSK